jgi:hypothetical protein
MNRSVTVRGRKSLWEFLKDTGTQWIEDEPFHVASELGGDRHTIECVAARIPAGTLPWGVAIAEIK